MCISHFVYLFIYQGKLGHFHLSAIVNDAAMNMDVQISIQDLVCHSGYIISHSHQQCIRVLISPYPCLHLLFSGFVFTVIILMGMIWVFDIPKEDVEHKVGSNVLKVLRGNFCQESRQWQSLLGSQFVPSPTSACEFWKKEMFQFLFSRTKKFWRSMD